MPRPRSVLASCAAVAAVALAVAAFGPLEPLTARPARAQTDTSVTAIQTPPPVPGIDYDAVDTDVAPAPSIAAATPAAPVDAGSTGGPAADGAVSANLGGSDVAVTSQGGSYEVDGPKRRLDRLPGGKNRP